MSFSLWIYSSFQSSFFFFGNSCQENVETFVYTFVPHYFFLLKITSLRYNLHITNSLILRFNVQPSPQSSFRRFLLVQKSFFMPYCIILQERNRPILQVIDSLYCYNSLSSFKDIMSYSIYLRILILVYLWLLLLSHSASSGVHSIHIYWVPRLQTL